MGFNARGEEANWKNFLELRELDEGSGNNGENDRNGQGNEVW